MASCLIKTMLLVALSMGVPIGAANTPQAEKALQFLRDQMDHYLSYGVYLHNWSAHNNFEPTGWVGDAQDVKVDPGVKTGCHSLGGESVSITYAPTDASPLGWSGIYWQHPANNWGNRPGVDLTGVTKLTFYARGEKGKEKVIFGYGGIGNDTTAFQDSIKSAITMEVELTDQWLPYSFDLSGKDLSSVIGGFYWSQKKCDNPGPTTIYLTEMQYEGYKNKLRLIESFRPITNHAIPQPMAEAKYAYVYQDKSAHPSMWDVSPPTSCALESGWMGDYGDMTCDSGATDDVHGGQTSIRIDYSAKAAQGAKWAGIYWQAPVFNWGDRIGSWDMTGAARLTFWAKGLVNNVGQLPKLEFKIGGLSGEYGDSAIKGIGPLALTNDWRQYTIDLAGLDLKRIGGGFVFTLKQSDNPFGCVFYLDDIRFESAGNPSTDVYLPPTFPPDSYIMKAAHTYDSVLALMAFTISSTPEDRERARLIADSLLLAQAKDEINDGRIRNVYYPDALQTQQVYSDETKNLLYDSVARHNYDIYGNGVSVGNVAWTILGLLNYHKVYGGQQYVDAAVRMGEYIHKHEHCTAGGYTAGWEGWLPKPIIHGYRATEHNIDVYVAFMKLYEETGISYWRDRAMEAKKFVQSMWDTSGHFWTGTEDDGRTVSVGNIPLDLHPWAYLALGNTYANGLMDYAKKFIITDTIDSGASAITFKGFDFNLGPRAPKDPAIGLDGAWFEGTAHMVTALQAASAQGNKRSDYYQYYNCNSEALYFRNQLRKVQTSAPNNDGKGIVATVKDRVYTGFGLSTGDPWYYYNRLHVGATSWFIFSELGYNPYWGTQVTEDIPYDPAVTPATPTVTWPTPASVFFGTALSATQLNATASVPGTFVYYPPAGTVLSVGKKTLSVTFTPTDTARYTTTMKTVALDVAGSIDTEDKPVLEFLNVDQNNYAHGFLSGVTPLEHILKVKAISMYGTYVRPQRGAEPDADTHFNADGTWSCDCWGYPGDQCHLISAYAYNTKNPDGNPIAASHFWRNDIQVPVLTVGTLPAQVSSTSLSLSGTAEDNLEVRDVYISLNGSAYTLVPSVPRSYINSNQTLYKTVCNSINWQADLTLKPGTNTVRILARDWAAHCAIKTLSVTVDAIANTNIATQPANKTVMVGQTATYTAVASGTGLTNQWYRRAHLEEATARFQGPLLPAIQQLRQPWPIRILGFSCE